MHRVLQFLAGCVLFHIAVSVVNYLYILWEYTP